MDDDVAQLVKAERLADAALLASSRGDARTACDLLERACDFSGAARQAALAGDHARALLLAVTGGDDAMAAHSLDRAVRDRAASNTLAARLIARGDFTWAARVYQGRGELASAASAWERAGEAVRAAELYEETHDPVQASKALEAALRREPSKPSLHLALGRLLMRYGKNEAAVRELQKVGLSASEHKAALFLLVKGFAALGLDAASAEAGRELERLGGAPQEELRQGQAEVKRRIYGRYDVVREVASTASARVIECVDSIRNERVAVKIMSSFESRGGGRDALARFEREVKVLGTLEHPNVVPLRDYIPDGPAMVLAWMSGGTLETMMQSPIAPARAVEIAQAVLSALGEAHRLGVLHRDVKPANVLFDDAGVARLADFGVAHLGDLGDRDRRPHRHARVHEPGAARGQAGHRAERPLRRWRHLVRDAHGRASCWRRKLGRRAPAHATQRRAPRSRSASRRGRAAIGVAGSHRASERRVHRAKGARRAVLAAYTRARRAEAEDAGRA